MGTIDAIEVNREAIVTVARRKRIPLYGVARIVIDWIVDRSAKRRSRSGLRDLTPDQLRDIGLTPSDVRREVAKSFFWD